MQKLLRIDGHTTAPLLSPEAAMARMPSGLQPRGGRSAAARAGALGELDRHRLADIGKTAEEARRECTKPSWRA